MKKHLSMVWKGVFGILLAVFVSFASAPATSLAQSSPPSEGSPVVKRLELLGQSGGSVHGIAIQDHYAYVGIGPRLVVLDIKDASHPIKVGQSGIMPGIVEDVVLSGTYAYVADGTAGGLRVLDISSPAVPRQVGSYLTPGHAHGLAISGHYIYVASITTDWFHLAGLRVIDVSDPTAPTEVGAYNTSAINVAIQGNYAYIVNDSNAGFEVIDISDPLQPESVGAFSASAYGVAVSGSYAYISCIYGGIKIINIETPTIPVQVGSYSDVNYGSNIVVSQNYAYIAGGPEGLKVLDISNPAAPTEAGSYDTPASVDDLALRGDQVFIIDNQNNYFRPPYYVIGSSLIIVKVSSPAAPKFIGRYDTHGAVNSLVISEGLSNKPKVTTLFSAGYAYVPDGAGLRIVDVRNPSVPVEVGFFDSRRSIKDVAVSKGFAYLAGGDNLLRIVDVRKPAHPLGKNAFKSPEGDSFLRLAVRNSYAYILGNKYIHIVDVHHPSTPKQVSTYAYSDSYLVWKVVVTGNYAYFFHTGSKAIGCGFMILNISNPANPVEVSSNRVGSNVCGAVDAIVEGNIVYEVTSSGLNIIDVSNPAYPTEVGNYLVSGSEVTAVAISRHLAYLTEKQARSTGGWNNGNLRVLDVTDPTSPVEIALYQIPGWANRITVINDLFIADDEGGLLIARFTDNPLLNNFPSPVVK